MPQFAVYKSPGRDESIPFVLQLQTTRLDQTVTRVVMPLVRAGARSPANHPLTPHLSVQGQTVYANPLNIATVLVSRLKDVLETLSDSDQDRIIRAIDEMVSRT